jgi:SAM-dependent methyltransferase
VFYGPEQAAIHHERFGALAADAARLVRGELQVAGISAGTVVDLGCGSGIYAAALTAAGYDVVGVDLSADMVALARANAPGATLTEGSIHDFAIPAGAVAVTALGEVVNYATDHRAGIDALAALAARVRAALAPNGVFVFDVATPGRSGPRPEQGRYVEGDGWAIGVRYAEHTDLPELERFITMFVRDGDSYRRVEEHHVLKLYPEAVVEQILHDAGFAYDVLAGYAGPVDFSGWKVFVAR